MGKARIRIVTDSTADLPSSIASELDIVVVPLNVHFGREVYRDGVDLAPEVFYRRLAECQNLPTTSQPAVGVFEEAYKRLARECDGIISIHISSKLSGTYASARTAASSISPGRCRVEVIDSLTTSLGLGFIVVAAAHAASRGLDVDEAVLEVRRVMHDVHILFVPDTLEYLQRGGRIGRAQAMVGSLLDIKPVLKIEDGVVQPVEKVRTRARAMDRLYEFVEFFPRVAEMGLVHSATPAEIEPLLTRIDAVYPRDKIVVTRLGAVLGTHVGPGTVGVVVRQGDEIRSTG
jgi:DegV family protein with EDD domain